MLSPINVHVFKVPQHSVFLKFILWVFKQAMISTDDPVLWVTSIRGN